MASPQCILMKDGEIYLLFDLFTDTSIELRFLMVINFLILKLIKTVDREE